MIFYSYSNHKHAITEKLTNSSIAKSLAGHKYNGALGFS